MAGTAHFIDLLMEFLCTRNNVWLVLTHGFLCSRNNVWLVLLIDRLSHGISLY